MLPLVEKKLSYLSKSSACLKTVISGQTMRLVTNPQIPFLQKFHLNGISVVLTGLATVLATDLLVEDTAGLKLAMRSGSGDLLLDQQGNYASIHVRAAHGNKSGLSASDIAKKREGNRERLKKERDEKEELVAAKAEKLAAEKAAAAKKKAAEEQAKQAAAAQAVAKRAEAEKVVKVPEKECDLEISCQNVPRRQGFSACLPFYPTLPC